MQKAIYKVPNGKLLKVFIETEALAHADSPCIRKIFITGDFFLYPEDDLELLEKALIGVEITESKIHAAIGAFLEKHQTHFYGLDSDSLTTTIVMAAHS